MPTPLNIPLFNLSKPYIFLIRATEAAEFDPKEKLWKVRLKPLKRKQ